IFLPVPNTKA
ncbi:hypothetical protein AVEN_9216-1, partial [Araneus ventricosus]